MRAFGLQVSPDPSDFHLGLPDDVDVRTAANPSTAPDMGTEPEASKREQSVMIGEVTLELRQGDIVRQGDVDAVVNAANAQLRTGGGVAGALHDAAGPGLEEECRQHAPIEPGEAVITGAHELPNRWVIHCLGPVHGRDEPADELLASCYRRALELADEAGARSIAFPSISTGAFGYPVREAGPVALRTVTGQAAGLETVRRIRFVLFSSDDLAANTEALDETI